MKLTLSRYCQAQLKSSPSPVQLELSRALILIISTYPHPPTPRIVVMRHFQSTQEDKIWYESFIQPNQVNQLTIQPPASLVSYPLATTSCSKLWLVMANSAMSSWIKTVRIGKLVYSASTIRLGVQLFTGYPLATTAVSYSQLWIMLLFQVGLKRCKLESWSTQQAQ